MGDHKSNWQKNGTQSGANALKVPDHQQEREAAKVKKERSDL